MQPGSEELHLGQVQHTWIVLTQLDEALQLGYFPRIHHQRLEQHTLHLFITSYTFILH